MAKKVVLEVEGFTKVLNFVSEQKISVPGAVEAFGILNTAILMDITITEKTEEVPPEPAGLTEQEIIDSFTPSAE